MAQPLPSGQSGRMAARPSGTVTLLFTDIEGSTRLWESQPEQMQCGVGPPRRAGSVGGRSRRRLRVQDGGRRLLRRVPDGSERARGCGAPRNTRSLGSGGRRTRRSGPGWRCIPGVCTERDGDYFGPTVNRVARLEAIGHGGQVLLSSATVALLGDDRPEGVQLRDMGEHRLKDLASAERVFQAVISGLDDSFPALRSLGNAEFRHNLPLQRRASSAASANCAKCRRSSGETVCSRSSARAARARRGSRCRSRAELLDGDGDGVWLVELAPVTDDADGRRQRSRRASGSSDVAGPSRSTTLVEHVAIAATAPRPRQLRARDRRVRGARRRRCCAGCPHVARARDEPRATRHRRRAALSGSPPLPTPVRAPARLRGAHEASEAVRLFVDRARASQPDFALDRGERGRRRRDLPAARRHSARDRAGGGPRCARSPVSEIASNLDDDASSSSRAATGSGAARHQTLRSVDRLVLRPARRIAAARPSRELSVFSGGWTLDAADCRVRDRSGQKHLDDRADTCAGGQEPSRDDPDRRRRDPLRHARDHPCLPADTLAGDGEEAVDTARAAHFRHFAAFAEQAAPQLTQPDQIAWFDRLDADAANLHAAVAYGVRHDPDAALRLVVGLDHTGTSAGTQRR